jgi:hypothetical protein
MNKIISLYSSHVPRKATYTERDCKIDISYTSNT